MDFLSEFDEEMARNDTYDVKFGNKVQRIGKIFSYTFWRTKIDGEIFWSVQGNNNDGSAWIVTQYFGRPEEAKRYQQEVILHHPTEKKIKMAYRSLCTKGMNCIKISRAIVCHFRDDTNSLNFEFRITRLKRRPYPQRIMWLIRSFTELSKAISRTFERSYRVTQSETKMNWIKLYSCSLKLDYVNSDDVLHLYYC